MAERRFEHKAVLVTGAAQGIGACIAEFFAAEGARVVIADADAKAGERRRLEIQEKRRAADFVQTDVGNPDDVLRMVGETMRLCGRLDVLVNNAGIGAAGPFLKRSVEDWDRVQAVNLRAAWLAAREAAPYLSEQKGSIVNIASTRALQSEADTEPYSASKGGLVSLTHSLAVTLAGRVRVNCVLPGWIVTDGWRFEKQKTEVTSADRKQHPAGRVGKPEDVAHACLFLASADAGFITGQKLVVDGGMSVKMIYLE